MDTEKITHPVTGKDIKVGDIMAFVSYVRVQSKSTDDYIAVKDLDHGTEIAIRGKELIESSFSANQFQEAVKVTKTKAAELLVSSVNRPLTVCFDKADGTERVLRGRLVRPEPLLGRSMVEDLETNDKNRLRQVDHRTIKWIIVEGVEYTVK